MKTPETAMELYLQMETDRHQQGLLKSISLMEEFCEVARKHIKNGHLPLHASGIRNYAVDIYERIAALQILEDVSKLVLK